MKKFYSFIVLFIILFQGNFATNLWAMDHTEERRLEKYLSPVEYLLSFQEGKNHGKPKILIIGAGLIYDDLVPNSKHHFLPTKTPLDLNQSKYHRIKHYPPNAYLIDFEGKFDYNEMIDSHSDFPADITHQIGSIHGLPGQFIDQFDVIILENVDLKAMTGQAFKNIYSLLKSGGKIICNVYFEVDIKNMDSLKQEGIKRKHFHESPILDQTNNVLTCLFYPSDWVDEDESLLTRSHIVSPVSNQHDQVYNAAQSDHEKHIISFQDFERNYKTVPTYKQFIVGKVKNIYEYNLENYFQKLIPDAKLSFTHDEVLWYGPIPKHGYFVISKK